MSLADGPARAHMMQRLTLPVGANVYGLGERFGAARQERPDRRHLERRRRHRERAGLQERAVLPDQPRLRRASSTTPGTSSFEVGSEAVERVAVLASPGEELEYFVIYGPTPKRSSRRYTALTGRPAASCPRGRSGCGCRRRSPPTTTRRPSRASSTAWPSATCRCRVFHFDCFWMREFQLVRLRVGPAMLPRPRRGMLARLQERGLRICVWINPYIAPALAAVRRGGRARLPGEATPTAAVWQWDLWQAGMALVDFTNPDAPRLVHQASCERCSTRESTASRPTSASASRPTSSGSTAPTRSAMHNYYAQLYNKAVLRGARRRAGRGRGGAVRPLGHRRRPAIPGALGRGLRLDVRSRWPRPCAAGCRSA